MTDKEKKQILTEAMGIYLPYGVHIELQGISGALHEMRVFHYYNNTNSVQEIDTYIDFFGDMDFIKVEAFKLILRPISTMTEKEMDTLFNILNIPKDGSGESWIKINDVTGIKFFIPEGVWVEDMSKALKYLASRKIDYMGLISMELAVESPDYLYVD